MAHTVHKVKRDKPQPTPISSHRLFPAMVALWFAALLGIGSIILPASLFDALAGQSGLGEAIPASGPLLANAKLAFTLVATVAGAALGLSLARRVAAGQKAEPVRRREFVTPAQPTPLDRVSAPRKPISVTDELLDTMEPEETENASRRRALAMAEPEGPSDWFHPNLPFSEIPPAAHEVADAPQAGPESEPLDLVDFPINDGPEPEIFEPSVQSPAEEQWDAPFAPPQSFTTPSWLEDSQDHEAERVDAPFGAEGHAEGEGELAQLGLADLAGRLDRAIRVRVEQQAERAQAEAQEQALEQAAANLFVTDAPIADDGGLQSFFAPPSSVQSLAEAETPLEEPAFEQQSFAPAPSLAIPRALRPVIQEELEEIDEQPFTLAPIVREQADSRQVFGSPVGFSEPAAEEAEEESFEELADENYGSLADLASPFRMGTEFVRVEEPEPKGDSVEPAVIFPGQAARRSAGLSTPAEPEVAASMPAVAQGFGFRRKNEASHAAPEPLSAFPAATPVTPPASADPAETERALRLALATLQRMSGAA